MKRFLFFALIFSLCSFVEAQAQGQTSSRKRPKFSPPSKRTGFAKPPVRAFEPHSWLKEMEGNSSQMARQDERLRQSLPPSRLAGQAMSELPPHLAAERQWLLQNETARAGLEPNDPLNRLYPPHKRPLAQMPNLLKNGASHHSVQSFESGTTQIFSGSKALAGGVQEAWMARHDEPGSSDDHAQDMVVDAAGNIYVTGYTKSSTSSSLDYLTVKYNAAGVRQWTARYNGPGDSYDYATALAVDGAGNVYVTGYSAKTPGYYNISSDYATVKYNSAGVQEWVATYNGPRNGDDYAYDVGVDGAGDAYVTGSNGTIKYNSDGAQVWVATYNGWLYAFTVDAAGNVYVTGSSGTIKYNSDGAQVWVATYNTWPYALAVDAAGNVYVTGTTWTGTSYGYATAKYNSTGAQQWVATYKGPVDYDYRRVGLGVDAAGNVYVTGHTWNVTGDTWNGINYDYVTVKYDTAGIKKWLRTYNGPGNGLDRAVALGLDAAGNVYVTGYSARDGEYWTSYDFTTVKYNSFGTQKWVKTYNTANGGYYDPLALGFDAAGNIYVTGSQSSSCTLSDYAIVKYGPGGVEKWAVRHDEPGHADDFVKAMAMDDAGNVYVTGNNCSQLITIKYNAAGVRQWVAHYTASGHPTDIGVDAAGNVYVTGNISGSGTNTDFVVIKYNGAGLQEWVTIYNGPGNSYDHAVALGIGPASGDVYVTGYSRKTLDDSYNYHDTSSDYVTVKYNAAGNLQWVATYNGPANLWDEATALALDAAGNVYVTGSVSAESVYDEYDDEYFTSTDYATIKYNSAGIQEWVAIYNGPGMHNDYAEAIGINPVSGDVYVTGSSWSFRDSRWNTSDEYDYATVKYNSAGTQEWAKVYYNGSGINDIASEAYHAPTLTVDSAGNVYVAGVEQWVYFDHDYDDDTSTSDYLVIKYNSAGTQQWAATYGGGWEGQGKYYDVAQALTVDGTGNVYLTGLTVYHEYDYDQDKLFYHYNYATIKYTAAGIKAWVATSSAPGGRWNFASTIAVDHADGGTNVYVAVSSVGSGTGSDFVTIKYIQNPVADAGADKAICAGGSVQIGGSPTGLSGQGGPYTFSWTPTTGLDNPTAPNPIASPAMTINYTVTVTETATGLTATDDIKITVPAIGWSVAHIVDVDDVIFGINQGATTGTTPRDNRGLALSPSERYLYLGYTAPPNQRLVRKIDLNVSDPAQNHKAVVVQLQLPPGTQPARDIATDDRGRVYLALGTKIEIYNSDLQAPSLHTIAGFTACEGLTARRENGKLVVYATDRLDKTLERFMLIEGNDEAITSSRRAGLDGDGETRISGTYSPRGLEVGSAGTAWIADPNRNKVYRVNSLGVTVDSTFVKRAMDVALDEKRKEVYVSQDTLRTIKVLTLAGKVKRTLIPPFADLNLESSQGALSGIAVASCARVYVANEKGRSILTAGDSPFSNVGDNNNIKAADTDPVLVVTGNGVAKESEVEEPEEEVAAAEAVAVTSYELAQNYPNPFSQIPRFAGNPSTTIRFALPEVAEVSLKIYDIAGQLVQTLVAGVVQAGRHQAVWDGTNQHGVQVASGVYFYQLRAGEFKQVRKMSLVR